ncbi:MAG: hypothetical protein DMG63_18110 [Acidobacteria bacterium]|nr:MAG: hypothetical protein DMG63_18110 [Acidobacteriota bacterium]
MSHISIRISPAFSKAGSFAHPDAGFFGAGATMNPPKQHYKNRILAALPKDEISRLARHLSPVTLEQEKTLLDGNMAHAYFLEDGIASVVVTVENGDTVEVGVIGCDGVVGIPILLGTGGAPGRTFISRTNAGRASHHSHFGCGTPAPGRSD